MKTHAALNNKMVDNDTKLVERIIDEVVDLDQFKDQRAGKLDLDDFLELLVQFNRRGIHFA